METGGGSGRLHFHWLIGYSALLGPIGGILIADYFVYRRRKLNLAALYQTDGEYRFTNGFSFVALIAFVAGVLPSLPGFLVNVQSCSRRKAFRLRSRTFTITRGSSDLPWRS